MNIKTLLKQNQMTKNLNCLTIEFIYNIDYNYDVPDATNDVFDPYFDEGYVRMVGDKIDYIRPHIVLDFKNDVQKYKDEIIKFIDNKID